MRLNLSNSYDWDFLRKAVNYIPKKFTWQMLNRVLNTFLQVYVHKYVKTILFTSYSAIFQSFNLHRFENKTPVSFLINKTVFVP